ncbi:hypothetical protein OR1_03936 [Geobacter sp. OR-1]|nr:hypothetical protein OR1_03936 [Geobacter sp. OR-1]
MAAAHGGKGVKYDLVGIGKDGIIVTGIDGLNPQGSDLLQAGKEFPAVRTAGRENPERSIAGKERRLIGGIETNGITGMAGGMHYPAIAIADTQSLPAAQAPFTSSEIAIGIDSGIESLDYHIEATSMIKVIVGDDNLLYTPLSDAGGNRFNFIENRAVGSGVDQRIYVFYPVPVSQNEIRTTAVDIRTAVKRKYFHGQRFRYNWASGVTCSNRWASSFGIFWVCSLAKNPPGASAA